MYIFIRMTYLKALDINYQYSFELDLKDFNQELNHKSVLVQIYMQLSGYEVYTAVHVCVLCLYIACRL